MREKNLIFLSELAPKSAAPHGCSWWEGAVLPWEEHSRDIQGTRSSSSLLPTGILGMMGQDQAPSPFKIPDHEIPESEAASGGEGPEIYP